MLEFLEWGSDDKDPLFLGKRLDRGWLVLPFGISRSAQAGDRIQIPKRVGLHNLANTGATVNRRISLGIVAGQEAFVMKIPLLNQHGDHVAEIFRDIF